jgi:formylglycine-generating enzyme
VNAAGPMRVGLKRANEIGVYDMSGNVTEWTWDISQAGFPMRRMRSGSYVHSETAVRLARRSESMPEVANAWVGLRVVRTP